MARLYWRVASAFWTDEKVLGWNDDTRMLALYILTCEHRTAEGLFRLPKGYICEDLGWSTQRLREPFTRLLQDGFIEYDESVKVCLILNALEYQSPENPNQVTAACKIIEELPATPLLMRFLALAERYSEPLAERLIERFGEGLGQPLSPPPPLSPPLAPPPPRGEDAPLVDLSEVVKTFHTLCPSLPKVRQLDDTRKKRLLKLADQMGIAGMQEFFTRVEASDLLAGRKTDWRADLDWIIEPKHATKILEGSYDNHGGALGKAATNVSRALALVAKCEAEEAQHGTV